MDAANFTSPLQAVQTISIFTYLNTLSDFLFARNFLNETNQYQPIPIVNALYNYIFDDYKEYNYSTIDYHENRTKIINERKIDLAGKLIEGTDLYGWKENEILDPTFGDAIYKHIINTLVFEKYTNIYGFLVEIIRSSVDVKINTMYEKINFQLSVEIFLTENGRETKLEPLVISHIIQDFITPLLPYPKGEMNLLAVDYVYAQAGSIFLHSTKRSDFTTVDGFDDYVTIAHAIENLVISGKIDKSALGIFALPALLHYVYKEKQKLRNQKNIINNSTLGIEAYKMLFTYLDKKFTEAEEAEKNDYRYQFHLALSNFKNRTTLAREIIRSKCSSVKENNLEDEVTKYKNNPDDYQCNSRNGKTLEDVNRLYQEQVDKIADKYFRYEKESIREAFGSDFIKSVDAAKVEISRGLVHNSYDGFSVYETQLVKEANDLFRFYFSDNETSVYYAILRKDNEITVVEENRSVFNCSTIFRGASSTTNSEASDGFASSANSGISTGTAASDNSTTYTVSPSSVNSAVSTDFALTTVIQCNPDAFRDKLHLDRTEKFRNNYFPVIKKSVDEKFDTFLNRIAEERAAKFKENLSLQGYDQTTKEWWKVFGLSFLPFYTCIHGIKTQNLEQTQLGCQLDVLLALPLVGEIGYLATKLTTAVTRSILFSAGTTLESLFLRTTIRETLANLGSILITEGAEFSSFFTSEIFRNLGLSLFRYVDPGFELIYTIGKGGLRSVITIIGALEKYSLSFRRLENILLETETKLLNSLRKVQTLFEKNIYVRSLSSKTGYGYRFLQLDNQILQIRKVEEYEGEIPLVRISKTSYKAVNIYSKEIKPQVLHLLDERLHLISPKFRIKSYHNSQLCAGSRKKRSLSICLRNALRERRKIIEKAAIDFTGQHLRELTEETVCKQLRRFVFPGNGQLQLNFVTEWRALIKSGNTNLPIWTKQYEIKDPDLFDKLRYSDAMDKSSVSLHDVLDGLKIIQNKNNPLRELNPMDEAPFFAEVFKLNKAYESVTFPDYYALYNYMTTGYTRINRNTIEAKNMREALYRLAIRQSDDPIEEFSQNLFRGETRSSEIVEKLFYSGKKEIEFQRFTSTSTNRNTAMKFQYRQNFDGVKIFYHMQFSERYFRAKVENIIGAYSEGESVLLPGSKFNIDNILKSVSRYGEDILHVRLSFRHEEFPKYLCYKNIMNELEKLKKNVPGNYDTDP
ncbi:uncharacterized protein LOC127277484 [Leptopilina boulardi]|uniref:uncharacterized protein LOC127277484 n=1 Tax=Leptopilina boulardi TaxID=63433 RepID=UPI0021F5271A|nr:uncharacterized protein LOC127277484 [Leptopilina boulardi]